MEKKLTNLLLLLLIVFFVGSLQTKASGMEYTEQQQTVSGTILDESRNPMPGVNIQVQGTTLGAMSDMNGKYSLSVPGPDAVLIFSFIGYVEMKVTVGGRATIDLSLEPLISSLEEVVVVGYGVVKKRDLTGSIVSVKSADLENLTMTDAAHAIQGKAAGVQIVNNSGAPGKEASIQIRGYSSNTKTNPLIIVDGLKVPSLTYLDPALIESIEILKDGASAAIYGIEAGNGVILVTTKTGSSGQGKIFYNYQQAYLNVANMPKMLNAEQYMDWQVLSGACTPANFEYDGVTDSYWADYMFETGIMPKHSIGFQGGNERGNLYLSLNYLKNDGIITGDKDSYNRISGQINADYKVKDWFTIGTTTSLENSVSKSITEASGTGISTMGSILLYDPITPWSYEPGTEPARVVSAINAGQPVPRDPVTGYVYGSSIFAGNSGIWHPATMRDRADSKSTAFNLLGTVFANFTPVKGLTITSRLGYRAGNIMASTYNYDLYINATATQKMSINGRSTNSLYYQWENFANYLFKVGSHELTTMAGMSFQDNSSDFVYGSANVLSNPAVNYRYLSNAVNSTSMSISGIPSESTNISYYGRIGWSLKNKYNIQASFRADAYDTSKLDRSSRWGYFPSVSGGWTISSEPFMDNFKSLISLSHLKLRVSYGILGNVNAIGDYQYNTTLGATIATGYDFGSGSGQLVGVSPSTRLANPKVKWETTRQTNIGLDARFLNDRMEVGVDWYYKNTYDLLTSVAASGITGGATMIVNAGLVNNKGLELTLGWRDKLGDFSYGINANFSTLKNEVLEGTSKDRVAGTSIFQSYPVTYFEEGYPLWYLRTFVVESVDPATGKPVYKDIDPNGVINALDQEYTGSGIPTHMYGATINLGYKNFDLTVYGSGVGGNQKLYALNRGDFPQQNTLLEFYENMWTPTNSTNPKYAKPNYTDTYYRASTHMIFDASYFKVKQIQLGYSIPKAILQKARVSELRAYVSLEDWFTFTKYPGLDPETSSNTTSSLAIDQANYPIAKKISFGVNVTF